MNIAEAYWNVVSDMSAHLNVSTQLAQIANFIDTQLPPAITTFRTILDKVYYFIPEQYLTTIIVVTLSIGVIRLAFSIVNLIWW